jgi:rubrerythrin
MKISTLSMRNVKAATVNRILEDESVSELEFLIAQIAYLEKQHFTLLQSARKAFEMFLVEAHVLDSISEQIIFVKQNAIKISSGEIRWTFVCQACKNTSKFTSRELCTREIKGTTYKLDVNKEVCPACQLDILEKTE